MTVKGQWYWCFVVLLASCLTYVVCLRCRKCQGATNLDECTQSIECGIGEECYIDEIVTSALQIVYYGGCRSSHNCTQAVDGLGVVGREVGRRNVQVCSECCSDDPVIFEECNSKLCSLRRDVVRSDQCFHCDSSDIRGSQGDVHDPAHCTYLATCNESEHCGVETLIESGETMHRFTCLPKTKCTLLTQIHLRDMLQCMGHGNDPHCGNFGRRHARSTNICTACCGDGLCNHGTCQQVLNRLYDMWRNNMLNFQTLRVNGTETTIQTVGTPTTPPPTLSFASGSTQTTPLPVTNATTAMLIPTLPHISIIPTKPEP